MRSIKYILILALILVSWLINGCIPEESPVEPHKSGDVQVATAEMGNLYGNQVYFSFKHDKVVSVNKITDWDIEFSCIPDTFVVRLNSAKFMTAYNTKKLKFDNVGPSDTNNLDVSQWRFDNPFGKLDSTAIGKWWEAIKAGEVISKSEVYIINRGVNERAKPQGYKKMQILGFENNTYYVKIANLDGTQVEELEIPRDPTKNFIQVTFNSPAKIVQIEPPTLDWDLCFTKYSELLYTSDGIPTWYSVTGPLINPKTVAVAIDTSRSFEEITYQIAEKYTYSSYINAIGHKWKWFDLGKGAYIINPNINYILRTQIGYIKMHFVGFYNQTGEKGYPKFEYQRL